MRRKGELSPSRVDREWRHQIMLPAEECLGQQYNVIAGFCADLLVLSDRWQRVFCFAKKADAEKFQARFGGVWFDPAQRRRGYSWMKVRPPKQKFY